MKRVVVKSVFDTFEYVMQHYYPADLEEMVERSDTYAIISIQDTHTGGFGVTFTPSQYCQDVLTLYFDDVIREVDGAVLFMDEMAKQIIDFIKKNRKVETLLVHCYVYYIDGCLQEECLVLLERYGELLINDGMNRFGFGCHESQDEIMLDKYNVVTIYSQQLSNYNEFFEAHGIEKVESLITAWDTFSDETPGQAERCDYEGKSVYDLPEELKDWGMYLADTRAE